MFDYFHGCSEILVPDNLKSGITTPCRYEPAPNRTYAELASHYGAVVIPARSYRPRDKAKVEVAVQVVQRWILARLRNRTFFCIEDLNAAIRELLVELNNRSMKHLGASRRELYERLDRPALKPLPLARFEMAEWKDCRANIDYHVAFDHNAYSVPYQLVHEKFAVRATIATVEIFLANRRIASHLRLHGRGKFQTLLEHMPSSHRAHAEWTPSRIIAWAGKTGPATGRLVDGIMKNKPHPEQGYRACLGIIRLADRYGSERVEAACARAERLHSYSYKTVSNILASRQDTLPLQDPEERPLATPPAHENIRGAGYYQEETGC
jgi:transposase